MLVLTISHLAMQFVLVFEFLQFRQLILQSLQVSLCSFVLLRVSGPRPHSMQSRDMFLSCVELCV